MDDRDSRYIPSPWGKSRRGRMATTILTAHPTPTLLLALEGKAGKINFFVAIRDFPTISVKEMVQ